MMKKTLIFIFTLAALSACQTEDPMEEIVVEEEKPQVGCYYPRDEPVIVSEK